MGTLDVLAFPRPLSLRPGVHLRTRACVGTDARGRGRGPAGMGGAGNWETGSGAVDSIPGRRNSGKAILGVPELARIHYNLPYMKY
jgi:hypothetical protein